MGTGRHPAAPPLLPHHRAYGSLSPIQQFDWAMLRVEVASLFLSMRGAVMAVMAAKDFGAALR